MKLVPGSQVKFASGGSIHVYTKDLILVPLNDFDKPLTRTPPNSPTSEKPELPMEFYAGNQLEAERFY